MRLPRRQIAAALVEDEQRWLPHLAPLLPIAIPTPIHVGAPAEGYPWAWGVIPWGPGGIAAFSAFVDPAWEARRLGEFVSALHRPAPPDAPSNPFRDGPLSDCDEPVKMRLERLAGVIVAAPAGRCWDGLMVTAVWPGPPLWLLGDLHSANVMVSDGAISTVNDFGDITAGDPATDLAIAWMLFEPSSRVMFRRYCGAPDDDTWARARDWALHFSLAYLATSADNPLMASIGVRTLEAVFADD